MINIIVAMDQNHLIGQGSRLPWNYPEDLRYFKQMTLGKTVLMGKTTFESIINRIGKPLPNRQSVVLTHDVNYQYPNVLVINDLEPFIHNHKDEDIFIIGGKQIYQQTLPLADRLYITYINKFYEGDVYFPIFDTSKYALISKKDQGDLSFCVYQRMD